MKRFADLLKTEVNNFINERKFQAFSDGYTYGYDTYLSMRMKHSGKNERAPLDPPVVRHGAPWLKSFRDNWDAGWSYGWRDADGDWLTSFSVQGMRAATAEYSLKEEQEMIRKKFDELDS